MYSNILSLIRTKEEIELMREEVRLLKDGLFKVGKDDFDEVLKTQVRVNVASSVAEALKTSASDKNIFLDGLESELNNFKIITLTIAFEPRGKTIEMLSSWVKTNLGGYVAIDFQYNPSIYAGVEIVYDGKFIDHSFKKIIEENLSLISNEKL